MGKKRLDLTVGLIAHMNGSGSHIAKSSVLILGNLRAERMQKTERSFVSCVTY